MHKVVESTRKDGLAPGRKGKAAGDLTVCVHSFWTAPITSSLTDSGRHKTHVHTYT